MVAQAEFLQKALLHILNGFDPNVNANTRIRSHSEVLYRPFNLIF